MPRFMWRSSASASRRRLLVVYRKPLAKLREVAGGAPVVLWNQDELAASGLEKQAILTELAAATLGRAAEV